MKLRLLLFIFITIIKYNIAQDISLETKKQEQDLDLSNLPSNLSSLASSLDLNSIMSMVGNLMGNSSNTDDKKTTEFTEEKILNNFNNITTDLKAELDNNIKQIQDKYDNNKQAAEKISETITSSAETQDTDAAKRISQSVYNKAIKAAEIEKQQSQQATKDRIENIIKKLQDNLNNFIKEHLQILQTETSEQITDQPEQSPTQVPAQIIEEPKAQESIIKNSQEIKLEPEQPEKEELNIIESTEDKIIL